MSFCYRVSRNFILTQCFFWNAKHFNDEAHRDCQTRTKVLLSFRTSDRQINIGEGGCHVTVLCVPWSWETLRLPVAQLVRLIFSQTLYVLRIRCLNWKLIFLKAKPGVFSNHNIHDIICTKYFTTNGLSMLIKKFIETRK